MVLFFAGRFVLGVHSPDQAFFVPFEAVGLATVSLLYSLGVLLFARRTSSPIRALVAYALIALTIGMLILQTGGVRSPFVAMWLFVGAFAGLFGWWVWGTVLIAANVGLVVSLLFSGIAIPSDHTIEMILVAEIPLIASYIIWHNRPEDTKGKAYTALAEQLSQVANKSEIVINSIADGVVAIDANGIIQLINPAAQNLLGWPKQDAIGLDYRSIIKLTDNSGKLVADSMSPIDQVLQTNQSITNNDLLVTTKSGKRLYVSLVVSPVGNVTPAAGAIAVFRNITKEREEERQKAEFISTASHEMRTPVASIEGYLGLALNPQTATIDDKARTYLQKAHESTQHLGRLFQDLLTVSKAEDARLVPHQTAVNIVSFTKEVVDGLAPKAKSKDIFLSFPPATADADGSKRITPAFYSLVDPGQLREVLNNLVDNAIKYTKQGSVIVNVTGDETTVTVSVTDTGMGIPPEDLSHLFQKFYRVDNSETREIGGTGLGLYISRRLIEANSGHISVESTLGKGSTFYVRLPRISTERATEILNTPA